MSFDWKAMVATVAPSVASVFGGPLAGMGVNFLARKLLGKETASEDELSAALAGAGPEVLLKLKAAEAEFLSEMKKADVELARISADDRASARAREIATGDDAPQILAGVIVVGFFGVLACVIFADVPTRMEATLNILLGGLATMLTQVGNYFFGSSVGSKKKDEAIGKYLLEP